MWIIETTDVFNAWYSSLDDADRANVLAALLVLRERGPLLPRPYADSVKDSCHGNMKELRIQSKGKPIRAFFAMIPTNSWIYIFQQVRRACLLYLAIYFLSAGQESFLCFIALNL